LIATVMVSVIKLRNFCSPAHFCLQGKSSAKESEIVRAKI